MIELFDGVKRGWAPLRLSHAIEIKVSEAETMYNETRTKYFNCTQIESNVTFDFFTTPRHFFSVSLSVSRSALFQIRSAIFR